MGGRPEREQKGRQGPDCTEPTQSWWELGFYSFFFFFFFNFLVVPHSIWDLSSLSRD